MLKFLFGFVVGFVAARSLPPSELDPSHELLMLARDAVERVLAEIKK